MHVRMKHRISGTRNGEEWPAVGEVKELPEDEAVSLIELGLAEEHALLEAPAETATVKPRRGRPPVKRG